MGMAPKLEYGEFPGDIDVKTGKQEPPKNIIVRIEDDGTIVDPEAAGGLDKSISEAADALEKTPQEIREMISKGEEVKW